MESRLALSREDIRQLRERREAYLRTISNMQADGDDPDHVRTVSEARFRLVSIEAMLRQAGARFEG
jgi:hypothetical protein